MVTELRKPSAASGPKRGLKWTCSFEYVDKDGIKRKGKGRTFTIDGVDVDLFPTGVLCGVIGRSRKTIYGWEASFGFPQALYYLTDDGRKKRWYSRRQLVAIQTLYNAYGQLKKENYGRIHQFIGSVRKVFYHVDLPKEKLSE